MTCKRHYVLINIVCIIYIACFYVNITLFFFFFLNSHFRINEVVIIVHMVTIILFKYSPKMFNLLFYKIIFHGLNMCTNACFLVYTLIWFNKYLFACIYCILVIDTFFYLHKPKLLHY